MRTSLRSASGIARAGLSRACFRSTGDAGIVRNGGSGNLSWVVLDCAGTGGGVRPRLPAPEFCVAVPASGYASGLSVRVTDCAHRSATWDIPGPCAVAAGGVTALAPLNYAPDQGLLFAEHFDNCVWGCDYAAETGGYGIGAGSSVPVARHIGGDRGGLCRQGGRDARQRAFRDLGLQLRACRERDARRAPRLPAQPRALRLAAALLRRGIPRLSVRRRRRRLRQPGHPRDSPHGQRRRTVLCRAVVPHLHRTRHGERRGLHGRVGRAAGVRGRRRAGRCRCRDGGRHFAVGAGCHPYGRPAACREADARRVAPGADVVRGRGRRKRVPLYVHGDPQRQKLLLDRRRRGTPHGPLRPWRAIASRSNPRPSAPPRAGMSRACACVRAPCCRWPTRRPTPSRRVTA